MRNYIKQNDNLETLQPQTRVFPDMTSVAQATIPEGEIFIVENIGMYIRLSNSNVLIFASAAASGVVGEIRAYCSSTPPTNDWLICDGSVFDETLCPDLYAILGDNHVPDLREYTTKMGSIIGQFDESEIEYHRHSAVVDHAHGGTYNSLHRRFLSRTSGNIGIGNIGSISFLDINFAPYIGNYSTAGYYSVTNFSNSQTGQSGSYYSGNGSPPYPSTTFRKLPPFQADPAYYPNLVRYYDFDGQGHPYDQQFYYFNVRFRSKEYSGSSSPYISWVISKYRYDNPQYSGDGWSSTQLDNFVDHQYDKYWKANFDTTPTISNATINGDTANTVSDFTVSGSIISLVNAESGAGVYYIIRAK